MNMQTLDKSIPHKAVATTTETGAQVILRTLRQQGVEVIFGYPGAAVLPIYDELFAAEGIRHILVRHEQAAVHAAEGYARSTGKPGVVLVTSGPGVTNCVTGLADAQMDSIPLVVLSGQVPTFLIGTDAFQECDTIGITRPCTKHNWLVKDPDDLGRTLRQAFDVATSGRPGPVLVDIPKDVQIAYANDTAPLRSKTPARVAPDLDLDAIEQLVIAMSEAKRPLFYTGGGVINSGPRAAELLRELVDLTGFPITSTLMGLGAYPGMGPNWLGMLGLHGLYEANMAAHDCDLLINIGARFDDRVTGNIAGFSPRSKKAHVDIDPSSINKIIRVDIPVVGDVAEVLAVIVAFWKARRRSPDQKAIGQWWKRIDTWRAQNCLRYSSSRDVIRPQHALTRLQEMTAGHDRYICTEVGQHQMWAAQYLKFDAPNRWMTSGGLGTMGYGFPASIGVQAANPDSLVINVAGDASWLMMMQELGTAVQHGLPVKQFIMNNARLGMVKQLQDVGYEGRHSQSWSESLPDFARFAEAYGILGIRCASPCELDEAIHRMIDHDGPVVVDCMVARDENVFPMIEPGQPHNRMLLG